MDTAEHSHEEVSVVALDVDEPVVEEAVAPEAEGDEVVLEMSSALGPELEVVELESILPCGAAGLALGIVPIKDKLPNSIGDGFEVFTREVGFVVSAVYHRRP